MRLEDREGDTAEVVAGPGSGQIEPRHTPAVKANTSRFSGAAAALVTTAAAWYVYMY